MIVAIASNDNNLKSTVSHNFGKCPIFCLFNTDTKEAVFVENSGFTSKTEAGMAAVNSLLNNKVEAVIAVRFGTKVITRLRKENVQMIIPQTSKTINEIINQLNSK